MDAADSFEAAFARRAPHLQLRRERSEDDRFLLSLFSACSPLATMMPPALLEHQWLMQRAAHRSAHPNATGWIALRADKPIGRFSIDWSGAAGAYGVDLAVLPQERGTLAGLHFLRAWLDAADALGRPATLDVLRDNPAAKIYRKLGFVEQDAREPSSPVMAMIRPPSAQPQTG